MTTAEPGGIDVVVAYALPERQWLLPVRVPAGSTVADAITASGLARRLPGLAIETLQVGIFGRLCRFDSTLRAGDRIELYRPLLADPKEIRRRRAEGDGRR